MYSSSPIVERARYGVITKQLSINNNASSEMIVNERIPYVYAFTVILKPGVLSI